MRSPLCQPKKLPIFDILNQENTLTYIKFQKPNVVLNRLTCRTLQHFQQSLRFGEKIVLVSLSRNTLLVFLNGGLELSSVFRFESRFEIVQQLSLLRSCQDDIFKSDQLYLSPLIFDFLVGRRIQYLSPLLQEDIFIYYVRSTVFDFIQCKSNVYKVSNFTK